MAEQLGIPRIITKENEKNNRIRKTRLIRGIINIRIN